MSIRRYKDIFSERLLRLLKRMEADSRPGVIHQTRVPSDYVLLLPLQHDSGIDKGRIALTQREGPSEHARRRLIDDGPTATGIDAGGWSRAQELHNIAAY